MINFALIDEHPICRLGLSLVLNKYFGAIDVQESGTIEEFKREHPFYNPDIVIFGLSHGMEETDEEWLYDIKREYPFSRIVIYGEFELFGIQKYGLCMSGLMASFNVDSFTYLSKQQSVEELINCMLAVLPRPVLYKKAN